MDSLAKKGGETEGHIRLKRLVLLWAQAHGYSACGLEVSLPRCRYRADIAAVKTNRAGDTTAVFECKQTLVDLRRHNGSTLSTQRRLAIAHRRRETLEKNLRVHYPALRIADSLFAEFDSYNFAEINHRGYNQVLRQLRALQNQLFDCTKFETLLRYRCANLFFLTLPDELYRELEIPIGWGALVETNGALMLRRKPVWQETTPDSQFRLLQRIAMTGTRALNRHLKITFEEVLTARCRSC